MKNDYVQASLQHSRFLFVYSAKHATELKRSGSEVGIAHSGVSQAKHATEMERSGIEVDALLIVVLVSCFQKNNKK